MMEFPLYREEGWKDISNVSPINYLQVGLLFHVLEQAFKLYLSIRQSGYYKKKELPKDLSEEIREIDRVSSSESKLLDQLKKKFDQSQRYGIDKSHFGFFSMSYCTLLEVVLVLSGYYVWTWVASEQIVSTYIKPSGFGDEYIPAAWKKEIATTACFIILQSLFAFFTKLPLSIYSTFVLEQKHGFNQTTPKLFIKDCVVMLLLENTLEPLITGVLIIAIRWGGDSAWFYAWLVILAFSILMLSIFPNYIMPLFNTYKPLDEGELRTAIEALASKQGFPLTKLYEVDGSKRSSHSNAYLYGFFKDKRIVLYDTLIRNPKEPTLECTTEEIVSILCHELGHHFQSHTLKGFVLQNCVFLVSLYAFGYFLNDKPLYAAFGFWSSMPVIIGITLFRLIITPALSILGLLVNAMTRLFEFQADAFAVQNGYHHSLKTGLCKISLSNLASFEVDPLYQMYHYSHPSLIERLRAMDKENEKVKVAKKKAN